MMTTSSLGGWRTDEHPKPLFSTPPPGARAMASIHESEARDPSSGFPDSSFREPAALGPGSRVGEYVLEEEIGSGGCGTVWRARHAVLPGVVAALKLPRDAILVDVLRRESLLQHGLEHPGILAVYGVDLEGPVPYLAQEYASGGDLAHLLAREGRLPVARALAIFCEAVDIVRFAHSQGVVHNDLKPGNILLDGEGRVRIGDFGLGRGIDLAAQTLASLSPERSGEFLWGTWEYMSPEQRDPSRRSHDDPSSDVYALGIILHEMLRGERPAGRVDLLDVSPEIDAIFARSWTSKDRRFRDAGELWNALLGARTATKKTRSRSGRAEARRRARRLAKRRPSRVRTFLWGLLFGVIASGGGLLWLREKEAWPFVAAVPASAHAPGPGFADPPRDEAEKLAAIRRRLESEPTSVEEARRLLRTFRAATHDPELAELARHWEDVIPAANARERYEVRWTRFAIDREKYGETVLATFEFGRPDVYLRVWQEHDGKRKLVFDTEAHPIEAWSHAWTLSDAPAFELDWAPGDRLTIELWDEDPFRDNRLERVELEGELSLFLLEGFQAGPSGHAVDFVTSHAFGK